jgi:hypothetical protein
MAKKVVKENENQIKVYYEKDSKRYKRCLIKENQLGIVGTIYMPKDKDFPEQVSMVFE